MWQWLLIYNNINNPYILVIVLEVLTIILIFTISDRLNNNTFNYIIISGISTIFYIINFNDDIFIIICMSLKLGLFPFNVWLIEIYKDFNSKLLIIWSILPKIFFLIVFTKYYWLFNNKVFLIWNIISIIIMSLFSYKLVKLSELLGISSIINNSYLYLIMDKEVFLIYYIIHILIISYFLNINNLWYNNIIAYFIFIIWIVSIIGIPPFIGFKIKYMILELYYNNILVIIGLILSSVYYIYLIKYINTGNKLIKWNNKISFISFLLI